MLQVYDVALIPLVAALVELCKKFGVHKKFLPIISIFFGIIFGLVYVHPYDLKGGIIVGLMIGLSASGLYSWTKNSIE